jgi:acetyl esterase/lipase
VSLTLLGGLSIALVGAIAWPAMAADPAAPTPTPPDVVVTSNVPYESDNPILVPGVLDVYAPSEVGPWPVVVLLHGAPSTASERGYLGQHARKLVDLGFVVFNADWGRATPGHTGDPTYDDLVANDSQAACAVEFARAHAAEYGGDPGTMIVFGHSGGAHPGATMAFGQPEPSAGCLGWTTLGAIDALVTWEGNWLLSANMPDWDGMLAADLRDLATDKDQKVVMLVSERPGAFFEREVGDPWAADSWLNVRDPSGDLRRQLETNGAFTDGILDFVEVQQLLFSVLEAQGNPVSLDVMPGSVHDSLSTAGWEVFLAAFPKAAAQD